MYKFLHCCRRHRHHRLRQFGSFNLLVRQSFLLSHCRIRWFRDGNMAEKPHLFHRLFKYRRRHGPVRNITSVLLALPHSLPFYLLLVYTFYFHIFCTLVLALPPSLFTHSQLSRIHFFFFFFIRFYSSLTLLYI